MGDKVRILNVSTTKRWSLWTGFLGDAKTYTVTYEQIPAARPQSVMPPQPRLNPGAGYCNSCGSPLQLGSRFCSSCGATVEPPTAGNETIESIQGWSATTAAKAECAACRFPNPLDASVCINCGKVLTSAPSTTAQTTTPKAGDKGSRWVWVCIAAVVVVVSAIVSVAPRTREDDPVAREGLSPDFCKKHPSAATCGSSPSTVNQAESTAPSNQQRQQQLGAFKPPPYRVYKSTTLVGTAYVVAANTTDDELRSLLWFFRKKVRTGQFADIGITKPTSTAWGHSYNDGMLLVYRGTKCANENFISEAQLEKGDLGACGYGDHSDAYYQWGISGNAANDSGAIGGTEIFNYQDNWHPPSEVSLDVDDKVKESWKARQQEWEPRQRFAVQLANEFLGKGLAVDVSANTDEPKELDFRSKLFKNATVLKAFTDTSLPKMLPAICKAGFQNIPVSTEGESNGGQSYPLNCR